MNMERTITKLISMLENKNLTEQETQDIKEIKERLSDVYVNHVITHSDLYNYVDELMEQAQECGKKIETEQEFIECVYETIFWMGYTSELRHQFNKWKANNKGE